jgi:uncharacterized protein (DUF1697 family)
MYIISIDEMEAGEHAVKHVALLRGINVGGRNPLPMKDLARLFERTGCENVRTYIQSGNVIFEGPAQPRKVAEAVSAAIQKKFGYKIPVVLRTAPQLNEIIRGNPFLWKTDAKWLHVYFLADLPSSQAIATLDAARSTPDVFHVAGREIYLHLPNGMARTKLTNAYFDSKLATVCTARNWATILKLSEMMEV